MYHLNQVRLNDVHVKHLKIKVKMSFSRAWIVMIACGAGMLFTVMLGGQLWCMDRQARSQLTTAGGTWARADARLCDGFFGCVGSGVLVLPKSAESAVPVRFRGMRRSKKKR